MKRHAALQDLSRDHFHALGMVASIRAALAGTPGAPAPAEALAALLAFWDEDASLHFREEEEVMVPIASRHGPPSADPALARMLDDHAWFRDAAARLALLRADGADPAAYRDLLGTFAERLEAHVHHEERDLFEALQRKLWESDLSDLAARSLAFRQGCRRPDRIGPAHPKPPDEAKAPG